MVHSCKKETIQYLSVLIDHLLAMARVSAMKTNLRVYAMHSMVEMIAQYFWKVKNDI